ncbi:MAG: NAD(P)-dependent oxidoreductase [bacterium]
MMNKELRIGFIGLGIMGKPMAGHIARAGYGLTVYNRTPGKAEELIQAGAVEVSSPREVAERSDIVITIVTDTQDVEQVLFNENGVAAGAHPGMIVIDMSTISPEGTRVFAERMATQGVHYLDAPVSGGDIGAINGTLTIMVGGDAAIFEQAKPLLATMGARVTHVGPNGSGQLVKSCNQVLVAINMVAVCEALMLASSAGLNLDTVLEVVTGGAANSWSLQNLGPRIAHGNLDPGFMVKLIQKDLNIVAKTAGDTHLPLPGTALATQFFQSTQALGGSDLGIQAMITAYEKLANRKL